MTRKHHRNRPPKRSFFMGMARSVTERHESWSEPYLLSLDEAAHRLSISRTTIWRLIKQQEFDVVSIGSRTFVTASSLDQFLTRHTSRKATP